MRLLVANNTNRVLSLMSGKAVSPGGSTTVEVEDEIYDLIQSVGSPDSLSKEDLNKYYETKELFDMQTAGRVSLTNVSSGGAFLYINEILADGDNLIVTIPVDCEIVAIGAIVDVQATADTTLTLEANSQTLIDFVIASTVVAGSVVYSEAIVAAEAEQDAWTPLDISLDEGGGGTGQVRTVIVYREKV